MTTKANPLPAKGRTVGSRSDAPGYWNRDILWLMLVTAEDTGGRSSMMEQLCRKGSGPSSHRRLWSDEMLYVLQAEVTFVVGEEILAGGPGTSVLVPRNMVHGFRVDSNETRLLNCYTPAAAAVTVNVDPGYLSAERIGPGHDLHSDFGK
jgi:quercetin dioxygenase-like cupin family protein